MGKLIFATISLIGTEEYKKSKQNAKGLSLQQRERNIRNVQAI